MPSDMNWMNWYVPCVYNQNHSNRVAKTSYRTVVRIIFVKIIGLLWQRSSVTPLGFTAISPSITIPRLLSVIPKSCKAVVSISSKLSLKKGIDFQVLERLCDILRIYYRIPVVVVQIKRFWSPARPMTTWYQPLEKRNSNLIKTR